MGERRFAEQSGEGVCFRGDRHSFDALEAIRGKTIKGTVFGDANFLPNGQLQPCYVVFTVREGKNVKLEALP